MSFLIGGLNTKSIGLFYCAGLNTTSSCVGVENFSHFAHLAIGKKIPPFVLLARCSSRRDLLPQEASTLNNSQEYGLVSQWLPKTVVFR